MGNVTPLPITTDHDSSMGIRDANGRWVRGPGRKFGSKNRQSAELMKTIRSMGARAIAVLSEALDNKEQWACQLILKYNLPARTIEMEGAEPEDIKQAFIDGEMSAEEIKAAATALEKLKNVSTIDDLKQRMEELTAMVKQQQGK